MARMTEQQLQEVVKRHIVDEKHKVVYCSIAKAG